MTRVRQSFDENTLAALLHDAAQHKARKRAERERKGIERSPRTSLWAQGVAHGLMVMDEHPAQAKPVLKRAQELVSRPPRYGAGVDPCKADAVHQRRLSYWQGVAFALSGSRVQARFFAKGAPQIKELVAVA